MIILQARPLLGMLGVRLAPDEARPDQARPDQTRPDRSRAKVVGTWVST